MFSSVLEEVVSKMKVNRVEKTENALILRKVFDTHMMVLANVKQKSLKKLAEKLASQKEVLAVEYMNKKRVFGMKASLDEMKSFKSKVER